MPRIVVLTLFIFLILRGKCALECGDGQYIKEEACRECKSTCVKCISEFLCIQCIAGFFGETCTKTCHEGCHAKLCDKETGACLSCKKGYYQTETCEQCPENCTECHNADTCTSCKTGYTGNVCQKRCVNCQPDSACSLEKGICNDGCKDEYSGYSCLEHCNTNCLSCDRVDAKKCFTCAKGKYGSNCEKPCHLKCIDNSCNKDTGSCLHLETDNDDKIYVTIIAILVVVAGVLVSVVCAMVWIKRRKARLSGRTQLATIESCAEGCSRNASEMCNLRYAVSHEENELPSDMGKQFGDQYEESRVKLVQDDHSNGGHEKEESQFQEENRHEYESLLETCHETSKAGALVQETGPISKGQSAEGSTEQTVEPPNQAGALVQETGPISKGQRAEGSTEQTVEPPYQGRKSHSGTKMQLKRLGDDMNSKTEDDSKSELEMSASGSIHQNLWENLAKFSEKMGVQGLTENFRVSLNKWKKFPLNIAVTGNSGTGKSSFINAIRGLKPTDKCAATVGVGETTTEPTAYSHPDKESLTLWDLPGVWLRKFPKDAYLQKVEFKRFDLFLIMFSNRLTENDMWLARQAQNLQKKCYFVRTKIDIDIHMYKQDYQCTFPRKVVLDTIRADIAQQLGAAGFEGPKIFLINNRNPEDFDFHTLSESLV